MRINFWKSPKQPPLAPVPRPPELQARAGRMLSIMHAMAAGAVDRHGKKLANLAGSAKLKRQLELIDALPNEAFAEFLDMLEAGVPEEFRHMLTD